MKKKELIEFTFISLTIISALLIFIPDPIDLLTAGFPLIESVVALISTLIAIKYSD